MPVKLKEINAIKRSEGWYERSIELTYDEVDPPFVTMLPTITHYVGKEKSMEANIEIAVKEIMSKFIESQKTPDISTSLAECEKSAESIVTALKAVK
jgi:hypothetical protein